MTTPSTIRLGLLAGLPPVLSAVPNILLLNAAADRLPDPIATHFGAHGADGFTGRTGTMFISAGVGTALGILFALVIVLAARTGKLTRTPQTPLDPIRFMVAASWGVGGFTGAIMFFGTRANLHLADAAAAELSGLAVLSALAIGVLFAVGGWFGAPKAPMAPSAQSPARPLPLGPTERVSWSRRISSPWMLLGGMTMAIAGVVAGFVTQPGIGVMLALTGALVAHLGVIRVVVDQRGLTVGTGPLGWPRWQLRPDEISAVATEDLSPARYGGYGIRMVPGATAVLLRSGPGIVVTRRSGRHFAVSVDDAGTGAAVLAGVVDRKA
ncbi:hypothetical protein [Nocardia sp. NPDC003345]